jgi:hypothetical protein
VSQQDLDSAEVASLLVNLRRLGPSHGMCAVSAGLQADRSNPSMDNAGILPRG